VHAFTAPVHYLFRPYIIYRSRDVARGAVRRGWEPVGTRDRERARGRSVR
jgi:nitrate reductase gamma subunit